MFSSKFDDNIGAVYSPYTLRKFIKSKYNYEGYSSHGIMFQLQRIFIEDIPWAKQ